MKPLKQCFTLNFKLASIKSLSAITSKPLVAHILLFVVNLMYAINYILAKGLMPNIIMPNAFILLRVVGATCLFWIVFAFNFERVHKKDWIRIMACALFGVAVNQLFFFNGLMRTSPLNSSIIMVATPIIVFVLSVFILKENITARKVIGVLVGAVGAISLILLSTNNVGTATPLGDLFIFINATSYSIYLVLVKPLMTKYKPLTVVTWVFTFGLVYVLLWPPTTGELMTTNFENWLEIDIYKVLFVIVGVTFLPYLLTVTAMKVISPSIASTYIYIQPVLVTVFIFLLFYFGFIDYSSDFSKYKMLAAILVFLGVYLVGRRNNK
ncbi:MAG: DMT family transporter [Crocinitomicaceae bacterium]